MKILAGPNSEQLALKIAEHLKLEVLTLHYKFFTDGETYLQIEEKLESDDVIIVHSTYPDQEKRLLELIFISRTLKEMGAGKIIAVVPYLCYARADRRRIEGEVVAHNITVDLLSESGINTLITVNVHNSEAFHKTTDNLEKYNLNALPIIVGHLKDIVNKTWIVVGPDKGSKKDIDMLSDELSISGFLLEKFRDPHTHEVQFKDATFNCLSKTIILFDDVITSGGTALKASKMILEQNPESLRFIVVHALSDSEIFKEMRNIGVQSVLSVNTVPREDIEQIDISNLISNFIEEKFL